MARLEGVEPPARGFEVGDRGIPEQPEASRPVTFRGVTESGVSPNVSPRPVNHGQFAALVLHGSEANQSSRRRCGLTLRYCPADVRAGLGWNAKGVIVSGKDESGHWGNAPRPETD